MGESAFIPSKLGTEFKRYKKPKKRTKLKKYTK